VRRDEDERAVDAQTGARGIGAFRAGFGAGGATGAAKTDGLSAAPRSSTAAVPRGPRHDPRPESELLIDEAKAAAMNRHAASPTSAPAALHSP
jgi:hypothetical protein